VPRLHLVGALLSGIRPAPGLRHPMATQFEPIRAGAFGDEPSAGSTDEASLFEESFPGQTRRRFSSFAVFGTRRCGTRLAT
jgi:hypothetical protein